MTQRHIGGMTGGSGSGCSRRDTWSLGIVLVGAVFVLSGCDQSVSATGGTQPQAGGVLQETPTPSVSISVADKAKDVRPDTPVKVEVGDGTLRSVMLRSAKGAAIEGALSEERSWTSSARLLPNTTYDLTAVALNDDGVESSKKIRFSTLKPKVTATYRVMSDGKTVGIGMPAVISFDSSVAKDKRADLERQVSITTVPAQEGAWGWAADNQLIWRPRTYWKPGTKVTVTAPLTGMQTGDKKWIAEDKKGAFTVGQARISTVDLKKHIMTVRVNGKVTDVYKISGGKKGRTTTTRSGTKIITEKHPFYVMDSSTYGVKEGDAEYYRQEVKYAMRVTNTGEFLHSAPWSVWAQGKRNVSHGCVNMSPQDARNMFDASLVGDVVDFIGSDRMMKPGDGMGIWLYTWDEWKATSALPGAGDGSAESSPGASAPSGGER